MTRWCGDAATVLASPPPWWHEGWDSPTSRPPTVISKIREGRSASPGAWLPSPFPGPGTDRFTAGWPAWHLLLLLALGKAWESGCLALQLLPISPCKRRGAGGSLGAPLRPSPAPLPTPCPWRLASAAFITGFALRLLAGYSPCEAQGGWQEQGEKLGHPSPPLHPCQATSLRFPTEGHLRKVLLFVAF